MNLDGKTPQSLGEPEINDLELADAWILSRYHQLIQQTETYLQKYGLGEAAKGLYEFIWGDFCDWYIELVKSRLQGKKTENSRLIAQKTLAYVLEGTLKLLHPFMPHITEEIWHTVTQKDSVSLAIQPYPVSNTEFINYQLESTFTLLFEAIRTIRNLRAEAEIKPGVKVSAILQSENEQERTILEASRTYIQDLGKIESLTITASLNEEIHQAIAGVVGTVQILIPLAGVVEIEQLRHKIAKNFSKIEKEIHALNSRLENPGFVQKAPNDIIETTKDSLAEAQKQAEILKERLNRLQ